MTCTSNLFATLVFTQEADIFLSMLKWGLRSAPILLMSRQAGQIDETASMPQVTLWDSAQPTLISSHHIAMGHQKRKNQHKRIIPLAKIMRQSSNVQIHCSNRTFTKRGFTRVLIILHISSDKGKICFWVPRHIQNRTIQTFVTQLWAMSTPFEFWLALALLDFVSSNRRQWSESIQKSPCCSTFESLRKIYIKMASYYFVQERGRPLV